MVVVPRGGKGQDLGAIFGQDRLQERELAAAREENDG